MSGKKAFFMDDTPHGRAKRWMYMKQLEEFIDRTQAHNHEGNGQERPQTIIYDACAGRGKYRNRWPESLEEYGSPLIALRVVLDFFIKKNNLTYTYDVNNENIEHIKCKHRFMKVRNKTVLPIEEKDIILIFSEHGRSVYLALVDNIIWVLNFYGISYTLIYAYDGILKIAFFDQKLSFCVNVVFADFSFIQSPDILSNRYLFTFIDPYGYKLSMSHIETFFGDRKEILIYFSSSVNRFKSATKQKETIMDLYGFNNDEMLHQLQDGSVDDCLQIYKQQITQRFQTDLILTFQMFDYRNTSIYHLIYVTRDQHLFEKMQAVMKQKSQKNDSLCFSDYAYQVLYKKQDNDLVAKTIFDKFKGEKKVAIRNIRKFVRKETEFFWCEDLLDILTEKPFYGKCLFHFSDDDST